MVEPEDATQTVVVQGEMRAITLGETGELDDSDELQRVERDFVWIISQTRVHVPHGSEVLVPVMQERPTPGPDWSWISETKELEDDDLEGIGHMMRPGFTDSEKIEQVVVVGTAPGGSTIEVGQPLGVRRVPTSTGLRSWELFEEAVAEGRKGLAEHEERKDRMFGFQALQQAQQQVFLGTQTDLSESRGPGNRCSAGR